MHCREFERRLNAALDERKRPEADTSLTAHAAECEDCRQFLEGQELLFVGLSRIAAPSLGCDFAPQVVAKAEMKRSPMVPFRARLLVATCLGSAAAMLVALSTVWYARRSDAVAVQKSAAAASPIVASRQGNPSLAMIQPGGPRRSVAPGGLTPVTGADWLIEAPRLPGHLRNCRGAIDELAIVLPEAALRLDEMEQMAPGIRPLRAALSIVWDTLCRTLPGARVDSPRPSRDNTSLWWFEQVRVA